VFITHGYSGNPLDSRSQSFEFDVHLQLPFTVYVYVVLIMCLCNLYVVSGFKTYVSRKLYKNPCQKMDDFLNFLLPETRLQWHMINGVFKLLVHAKIVLWKWIFFCGRVLFKQIILHLVVWDRYCFIERYESETNIRTNTTRIYNSVSLSKSNHNNICNKYFKALLFFKSRVQCFSMQVVMNKCSLLNPEKSFGAEKNAHFNSEKLRHPTAEG